MKKIKNTKQIIANYDTLYQAWLQVKKKKSYTDYILDFESNLAVNLNNLLSKLDNGTYQVNGYNTFYIHEPKLRLIEAPKIEDRIVQHALLIAVGDKLNNKMISNCFACRKGKGTHLANQLLQKSLVKYKSEGYYLRIDIKKYFYSIDHSTLTRVLSKYISCRFALDLFKKFYGYKDTGIPLGNVTSQTLANIFLNEVDQYAKRGLKCKDYFRYMDDIIILGEDKKYLTNVKNKIIELIKSLNLEANNKTQICEIKSGVDFTGYRTWYNRKVIRKRSLFRIKRTLKKQTDKQRVSSFLSHSKLTNSLAYVKNIILQYADTQMEVFIKKWEIKNENI